VGDHKNRNTMKTVALIMSVITEVKPTKQFVKTQVHNTNRSINQSMNSCIKRK
jgi:hypothetical protein